MYTMVERFQIKIKKNKRRKWLKLESVQFKEIQVHQITTTIFVVHLLLIENNIFEI